MRKLIKFFGLSMMTATMTLATIMASAVPSVHLLRPRAEKKQPAAQAAPAHTVNVAPAAQTVGKQCATQTVAQARRAKERAAAYALVSAEGPVADSGDAGAIIEPTKATGPECRGGTVMDI